MTLWQPPPLGTLIDYGSLKLVEVLKNGHYEVVYRAGTNQTLIQYVFHSREIALHRLASGHPSVVTLHRVVEDANYVFMITDFSSDGHLLYQISVMRRYLGNDALIKQVFLQILDATEHCHAIGIYHRGLHPGNIMCFDQGRRVAINNFRGATINTLSTGFRQGAAYSAPECQPSHDPKPYSPMHGDIWALGILLMTLVTGRTPWRSPDVHSDRDYAAYVRRPSHFFSTQFPVSRELRHLMLETLTVNSRERISLPRLKIAVENMRTFYPRDAVFIDGVAMCPWQFRSCGNGIDNEAYSTSPERETNQRCCRTPKRHLLWDEWPNRRYAGLWNRPDY